MRGNASGKDFWGQMMICEAEDEAEFLSLVTFFFILVPRFPELI